MTVTGRCSCGNRIAMKGETMQDAQVKRTASVQPSVLMLSTWCDTFKMPIVLGVSLTIQLTFFL